MKYIILLILLSFLAACNSTVKSIKTDQDTILTNDTGYILMGVETNRQLKSIKLSGPETISFSHQDLKHGKNYILVNVEAGDYFIEKIDVNRRWRAKLDDEDNWLIRVEPGKVNYVGHLEFKSKGFWFMYYEAELVNKSSYALEHMENNFSNILSSREIFYGGPGTDEFFKYIPNIKREGEE